MKIKTISKKEKTSFYIDKELVKRMKPFLVKTKKTDFINESLEEKIIQLEKQKAKKKLLEMLANIKPIKTKKTALQIVHDTRKKRDQQIMNNIKKLDKFSTEDLMKNFINLIKTDSTKK